MIIEQRLIDTALLGATEEARRIIKKLEIHCTPKHDSWLDIAEIELNMMTRQCLSRRIPDIENLCEKLNARESEWNNFSLIIGAN